MWESEFTWFSVGIEIDCFLRRIEIDFVVFGPIIVWFSCMDRNSLGFSPGIAIDLFVLSGPKMTFFKTWRSIDLVLVEVVEIELFLYAGRN